MSKMTPKEKRAHIDRLEKNLKADEANVAICRQRVRETTRDLENAEQQLFETRKALIVALNDLEK